MSSLRIGTIFASVLAISAWASTGVTKAVPRADTKVTFCTDAKYDSWETCDSQSIPTIGGGSCASLALEPGICYNWDSFPNDNIAALVNNVSFVHVPCCGGPIYSCDLYTTTDCSGDKGYAGLGETGLDCQQPVFNDKVNSFYCVSN